MTNDTTYEILDTLAVRYIPEGRHKYLHVDSRDAWISLMCSMLERGSIRFKISTLAKCAIYWEDLLVHKLSMLN